MNRSKSFALITLFLLLSPHAFSQKIEPEDINKIASSTIAIKGYPDWLATQGRFVWVSNKDMIQRINPATNSVDAEIKVNGPCAAFTIGFGSIWTASCTNKSIVRIDIESRMIVASIPLTIADDEGSIVAAENGVWILSDKKGVLTRINPRTNSIVKEIPVKPNSFAAMAGFGSIWITNTGDTKSNEPGSVQRIDPRTNKVISTITVGKQPRFLAVGEGGVWTFNQTEGSVSRIDPKTNKVVATIECNLPGTGGDIATGAGYVWVRGKKDLLLMINPRTNKIEAKFGPPAGSGAVRVGNGIVWVTAHDVNKVWGIKMKE